MSLKEVHVEEHGQELPTPEQEMNSRAEPQANSKAGSEITCPNLWCPDLLNLPHFFALGGKAAVVHG